MLGSRGWHGTVAFVTRTEAFGWTNHLLLCSPPFKRLLLRDPAGGTHEKSTLSVSFTMLVLHPTSGCDICYDTYGQENPASTIPCGHIFCYRYVSPGSHRRDTSHFRLSVSPRVLPSTDAFPCADRACARCVEKSSRAPMSRNLGRPTSGMVEPKRLFAVRFRQHRVHQAVGSNDGIL